MKTYEAYIAGRLVRTFNARDLAEGFRERMAALGAAVEVKVAFLQRRAA